MRDIKQSTDDICEVCGEPLCPVGARASDNKEINRIIIRQHIRQKEEMYAIEELVSQLIDSCNRMGGENLAYFAVARQLSRTHRTRQQNFMDQIIRGAIDYFALLEENNRYDDRNKSSVQLAARLKEIMDDQPLPYI